MPDIIDISYTCPLCGKKSYTRTDALKCKFNIYTKPTVTAGDTIINLITGKPMSVVNTYVTQPNDKLDRKYWHSNIIVAKPVFKNKIDSTTYALKFDEYTKYYFLPDELLNKKRQEII